jgi:hypothetical protein
MSQATTWGNYTSGPASPNDYAAREKQSFDALLSMHSGSSRPAYAVVGTQWADTSVSGKIAVKVYDGTADRLIYTIDIATGVKTFAAFDLAADPASAMQPATKQWVDGKTTGITNANLATMAQQTIKGRASGAGTGTPTDLSAADVFAIIGSLVPARPITGSGVGQFLSFTPGAGNGYTLPAGGTWAAVWMGIAIPGNAWASGVNAAVAAGGTALFTGSGSISWSGFAWRIA